MFERAAQQRCDTRRANKETDRAKDEAGIRRRKRKSKQEPKSERQRRSVQKIFMKFRMNAKYVK